MTAHTTFYLDFVSPNSYIAAQGIGDIATKHARAVDWRPVSLFHIWDTIDHHPLGKPRAKARYLVRDFKRSAEIAGLPLTMPKPIPLDADLARRTFYRIEARDSELAQAFALAVLDRYWAEGEDISTSEQIAGNTAALGVGADELMAAAGDEAAAMTATRRRSGRAPLAFPTSSSMASPSGARTASPTWTGGWNANRRNDSGLRETMADKGADKGVVLVAGVGGGLGFGICRRFAAAGYDVAMVSRKPERLRPLAKRINEDSGGRAHVCPADVRDEATVEELFDRVEAAFGPIAAAVFNAGAQYRKPFLEIPPDLFEKVWRLGCYAGFLIGRAAARRMLPRGEGSILFTGATASIRGAAEFAAFAASKSGLRALAQSMAREFGPQGIHVAHVVVDGLIDTPVIRERFAEQIASLPPQGALSPEAIGQAFVDLHHQSRSAWSFEIDLRPWSEKF